MHDEQNGWCGVHEKDVPAARGLVVTGCMMFWLVVGFVLGRLS